MLPRDSNSSISTILGKVSNFDSVNPDLVRLTEWTFDRKRNKRRGKTNITVIESRVRKAHTKQGWSTKINKYLIIEIKFFILFVTIRFFIFACMVAYVKALSQIFINNLTTCHND